MINRINTYKSMLLCVLFVVCSLKGGAQEKINQFDANGLKTGKWAKHYSNGNYRYKGQFVADREVGVFEYYTEVNPNTPAIIREYETGSDICKVRFYTNTGALESEGRMKGKMRLGDWKYYNTARGNLILSEHYENGKRSGKTTIYYLDGTITEISHFKEGLLHGECLRYTDQGALITKIPYQEGKIHGKVFYYDNNGLIRETGFYDKGKRVGRWEFYIDGVLAGVEEPNKQKKRISSTRKK